jgi:hypothetical protein
MNRMILPATGNSFIVCKVGTFGSNTTLKHIEDIKRWADKNMFSAKNWPTKIKELFGQDISLEGFPKISGDYVYIVECDQSCSIDDEILKQWKHGLDLANYEKDCILYIWGGYSLKRINKILVPFL